MDASAASWGASPPPGEPTTAGPGTEHKIEVMIERAARREPLFHPLDGLYQTQRRPLPVLPETPGLRLESA
jgi:hypothetical protein